MKKVTTIFVEVVLFVLASLGTAFAATISKTFEFGPGTQYSTSVFRTFPVPCGRQVTAVVSFARLGPPGTSNDIPITIELREPETAPNQEGPIVETKNATAKTNQQTVTILSFSGGNPRGCTLPWRVRVKHGSRSLSQLSHDDIPPFAVSGTIKLDYDGSMRVINAPFSGILFPGDSKTTILGSTVGFDQGRIEITAKWHHQLGTTFQGPNPIKLRIELVNPSGATVRTVEAYSSVELRSELTKFRLVYQLANCTPGQWKLKITNIDINDDVGLDFANANFTPGC